MKGAMVFGVVYNDGTGEFVLQYVDGGLLAHSQQVAKESNKKVRAVIPFACCDLCGELTPMTGDAFFLYKKDAETNAWLHEFLYCMDALQEYGGIKFKREYDWHYFDDNTETIVKTMYGICDECFDNNTDEDLQKKFDIKQVVW